MELTELVEHVLSGNLIAARQWVADARREKVDWNQFGRPGGLSGRELTVAAGLVELLALRSGDTPPAWALKIGPEPLPLVLDPGLEQMPRSFALATAAGPEPLRRRNLVALPDFLAVA